MITDVTGLSRASRAGRFACWSRHALRDRLTVEEAAQLGAQLPMLVRGIYYEGWDPTRVPVKMHREELLRRVRQEFPYDVARGIEAVVRTVLGTMRQHITDGEWADIKSAMPKDLPPPCPTRLG